MHIFHSIVRWVLVASCWSWGICSVSGQERTRAAVDDWPQPKLAEYRNEIAPILNAACAKCHGAESQDSSFRIDTLDPDLQHGEDVSWWLEVYKVLSNGEMPPEDGGELGDAECSQVIQWLSSEIQVASAVRRSEQGHSSFRRLTRYETNYALQDLLGLPYEFTQDLPPETASADGFHNSSEVLHMSAVQFAQYRELSRQALDKATVRGLKPEPIYWNISMEAAASKLQSRYDAELEAKERKFANDPEKLERELAKYAAKFADPPRNAHYKNLTNGAMFTAAWSYGGAKYAWQPTAAPAEVPAKSEYVAIIPARQKLIIELGNTVPDVGTLRVRVRASQVAADSHAIPSLRLEYGFQASNNSAAAATISKSDVPILAAPAAPKIYQWDIPLCEIALRNPMRRTAKMGETPNPSEYLKLVNSGVSSGDIQIDYVEVSAPVYDQWPPEWHAGIFIDSPHKHDEHTYAREILKPFMFRAWRREVTAAEVDQKLALFKKLRPDCHDFQEAMLEVLATVLASPKFLYVSQVEETDRSESLSDYELATRLSLFLWCSTPDQELLGLAAEGQLSEAATLVKQTNRMLADDRSQRFCHQFVRQWLGMQLLDYLAVDEKKYPQFDASLLEAMREEPVAFFRELLDGDRSVLEFVQSDYALVNERLAKHYGLSGVYGNHFRRVALQPEDHRGGVLTQAGLLAMNSDGKDSHPLKRGIWLLERLLNDPPPPPPPAVPVIDLTDPAIAKLTLKERLEDHRNDPACMSCHAKIDPWGIAFENFDAVGSWRTMIGDTPVDASSLLFNKQRLDGMGGLKRFLLTNRQDQFTHAMTHKLTTFALGRPLTFSDRSEIDRIAIELRQNGNGLATLINLIVASELFQSK